MITININKIYEYILLRRKKLIKICVILLIIQCILTFGISPIITAKVPPLIEKETGIVMEIESAGMSIFGAKAGVGRLQIRNPAGFAEPNIFFAKKPYFLFWLLYG